MSGSQRQPAEDAALYCEFGRTMRAAQMFEYAVRQLVSLDEFLGGRTGNDVGDEIDRFFRRPLAKLAKILGVEEALADELRGAVATRNTLAHNYLITAFLEINVGISTHEELIAILRDARSRYEDLNARLDAMAEERHSELGINPMDYFDTPDAMRRAMLGDDEG
jgi:hypothetical protein